METEHTDKEWTMGEGLDDLKAKVERLPANISDYDFKDIMRKIDAMKTVAKEDDEMRANLIEIFCRVTPCEGKLRMTGRLLDSIGEEIPDTDHILKCEDCGAFWHLNLTEGPREIEE